MANVVKTYFLLTSLEHYGRVRAAETEFYERHAPQLVATPPAATLMVVPALAHPDLLVQYEVVAALDREMPGWPVTYYPERWAGRELAYPHVPKEHAKFARSQAVGSLLAVSGCQALDHQTVRVETADVAEQSRIVLDKVRLAVEETGGSLADLLKTKVFVKDAAALAVYRDVEQAFLHEHAPETAAAPPASAAFLMAELPRPEFLVEVEAFAVSRAAGADWEVHSRDGSAHAAESVSAGPLVFLSACHGVDGSPPPGVEQEIGTALERLRAALERAGAGPGGLVRVTAALADAADVPALEAALRSFYGAHAPELLERPPATTVLQAAAIAPAGARFQVDAVGVA
jgi:enamine deaminase RidA (YjgF/YER057c/UK114 family)